MKLATFAIDNNLGLGAVVDNDQVLIDLAAADRHLAIQEGRTETGVFSDMLTFLNAGSEAMATARRVIATAPQDARIDLADVRLLAPVPLPRKLLCLAGNYQDHIEEEGSKMSEADQQTPRVFMKPPSNTVVGPHDPILIPPIAQGIDWEGELAVIIGRRCKAVKPEDAMQMVAGYTCVNDVSERKLKIKERTESRPKDEWFDWLNGKWFDSFAPLGPWMVTTDEITNPHSLDISTWVNGERKQHNNTGMMLYRIPETIAYISAMLTLEPGDIICTGTISGVGATTGSFLKPGDTVKVVIEGIGELVNPVAAES